MSSPANCLEPLETVKEILRISEDLAQIKDVDAILDKILFEARRLSSADAGTIYLVKDDRLTFSYVHNDTLFQSEANNKHIYSNVAMPINEHSIVGYVALKGETLNIEDAYAMPSSLPFEFNPAFDRKTGYRTRSILTIPIKNSQAKVVGVMQIINAKGDNGGSVPFSLASQTYLPLFANNASIAIERGVMTRELILRMMKMAELRDPTETGAHVQRVGAYSAEIYHKWALMGGVSSKELKKNKDLIRIAAMLHDVGKVGISDTILKKPAKLDEEEYAIMKQHTVYGAQMFINSTSDLDSLSADIALMHHEKWDGTGYPGRVDNLFGDAVILGTPKKGEEIPLGARICALADVFDALSSKRSYKSQWSDDQVVEEITRQSGKHFDPDVVVAFLSIFDVITAIRDKYTEQSSAKAPESAPGARSN